MPKMTLSRIKALGPWMAEGRFVWVSLDVNLFALIVATHPAATQRLILYTGLLLQVVGLTTVVWGILRTRADFRHATLRSGVKAWMQRCPLFTRVVTLEIADSGHASAATSLSVIQTYSLGPDATLDMRLEAAEKNIVGIHNRITGVEDRLAEKFNDALAKLRHESEARQSGDTKSLKTVERTATGGLPLATFGTSCLFMGTIFSTLAGDIEKWF